MVLAVEACGKPRSVAVSNALMLRILFITVGSDKGRERRWPSRYPLKKYPRLRQEILFRLLISNIVAKLGPDILNGTTEVLDYLERRTD
jgi:hypothetical protein